MCWNNNDLSAFTNGASAVPLRAGLFCFWKQSCQCHFERHTFTLMFLVFSAQMSTKAEARSRSSPETDKYSVSITTLELLQLLKTDTRATV